MSVFSAEYSSRQGIKEKTRLFRVASSPQGFSSGFSTTRFSENRSICFSHMPPTTSIYSLISGSLQGIDAMIKNWNMGLQHAFPSFNMISRVLLKIKQEYVPLLILIAPACSTQPWYPELLNLCVKEPVLLPRGKQILISSKSIVHRLMVENSLTLAAWLVSGKPFLVTEFQETFLTLSKIPHEKANSLIMRQPGENGLASVLNKKLILSRHL